MIHSEAGRIFIALGIGKCNLSSDKKKEKQLKEMLPRLDHWVYFS